MFWSWADQPGQSCMTEGLDMCGEDRMQQQQTWGGCNALGIRWAKLR